MNKTKSPKDIVALKDEINSENKRVVNAMEDAKTIARYSRLLARAITIGAAKANLEHQGFQAIEQLIDSGDDNLPGCAICLGALKDPVCTECVHLFCSDCLKNHSMAMPLISHGFNSENRFPCPLCRNMLNCSEVIQILPQNSNKSHEKSNNENIRLFQGSGCDGEKPMWFPALTPPEINQIASEAMKSLPHRRLPINRFAGMEALDRRLVKLLNNIMTKPKLRSKEYTSHRSRKIQYILQDITGIIESSEEKIVIFSQFKSVVVHFSKILDADSIGHRKIVKGDQEPVLKQAVDDFNNKEAIRVLLLHASDTTAGLTLTCANHVMFVEPFLERSAKLQAINRAHRMGQTGQVHVRTYFIQGTVEERIVAFTDWQSQGLADTDAMAALPVSTESAEVDDGLFLRYVSGVSKHEHRHS